MLKLAKYLPEWRGIASSRSCSKQARQLKIEEELSIKIINKKAIAGRLRFAEAALKIHKMLLIWEKVSES